jgi:hypothetical protein
METLMESDFLMIAIVNMQRGAVIIVSSSSSSSVFCEQFI